MASFVVIAFNLPIASLPLSFRDSITAPVRHPDISPIKGDRLWINANGNRADVYSVTGTQLRHIMAVGVCYADVSPIKCDSAWIRADGKHCENGSVAYAHLRYLGLAGNRHPEINSIKCDADGGPHIKLTKFGSIT